MAQHDYVIDNQSAPSFRSDLNNALSAVVSQNSGATAPTVTFANMLWYDTVNNQLKKRNEADSGWITLGTIDETAGTFTPSGTPILPKFSNVQVFTSSGTFVTPAGVTEAYAIVIGGGGGGGRYNSGANAGGLGGIGVGLVSVSGSMTVTVGAGGTLSNSGTGGTGGTSSFGTISATGGTGSDGPTAGTQGSSTGGYRSTFVQADRLSALMGPLPFHPLISAALYPPLVPNGAGQPTAWTTSSPAIPGGAGTGEDPSGTSNNASGGMPGAVIIGY